MNPNLPMCLALDAGLGGYYATQGCSNSRGSIRNFPRARVPMMGLKSVPKRILPNISPWEEMSVNVIQVSSLHAQDLAAGAGCWCTEFLGGGSGPPRASSGGQGAAGAVGRALAGRRVEHPAALLEGSRAQPGGHLGPAVPAGTFGSTECARTAAAGPCRTVRQPWFLHPDSEVALC